MSLKAELLIQGWDVGEPEGMKLDAILDVEGLGQWNIDSPSSDTDHEFNIYLMFDADAENRRASAIGFDFHTDSEDMARDYIRAMTQCTTVNACEEISRHFETEFHDATDC